MLKEERTKPVIPQIKRLESQDDWISEEELYTEGSSDEDDMALRMKRRERKGENKGKTYKGKVQPSGVDKTVVERLTNNEEEINQAIDCPDDNIICEQEYDDDSYKWRPTQGSFKLKDVGASGDKKVTNRKETIGDDS